MYIKFLSNFFMGPQPRPREYIFLVLFWGVGHFGLSMRVIWWFLFKIMSFGVIWLGGGTCENGVVWEDLLQMSVLSSDLMLEACSLQISKKNFCSCSYYVGIFVSIPNVSQHYASSLSLCFNNFILFSFRINEVAW